MVVMRWRKSSPYCDADKKYIRRKGMGSFSATIAVKQLFKITKTPVSAERINYTTESRLWTRNAKVSSRQHGCHAPEKDHHEIVIQIKKYIRKKETGSFFCNIYLEATLQHVPWTNLPMKLKTNRPLP